MKASARNLAEATLLSEILPEIRGRNRTGTELPQEVAENARARARECPTLAGVEPLVAEAKRDLVSVEALRLAMSRTAKGYQRQIFFV